MSSPTDRTVIDTNKWSRQSKMVNRATAPGIAVWSKMRGGARYHRINSRCAASRRIPPSQSGFGAEDARGYACRGHILATLSATVARSESNKSA